MGGGGVEGRGGGKDFFSSFRFWTGNLREAQRRPGASFGARLSERVNLILRPNEIKKNQIYLGELKVRHALRTKKKNEMLNS